MATIEFQRGFGAMMTVEAASVTGKAYQLKDFGNVEISAANKGVFWKVNSLTYNATQNTVEKPHVGTDAQDTIATTKTYEGTIDLDFIKASADVTVIGTTTTTHVIDPKTIFKQVVNGQGETYTAKIYIGCDLKTAAANGNEDHADQDTADLVITLNELIFTSIPFTANPGDILTLSVPVRFKSSSLA